MNKNFLFAVSTLVGAIVGLGMFGIPYTVSRAGFFIGIGYIIVLGFVFLLLHLMYGEVVERTSGRHRLTGYTEKYLGKYWKRFIGLGIVFTIYAALLAYIIVGGKFLSLLFPGLATPLLSGSLLGFYYEFLYGEAYIWTILSIGVWRGIRTVGRVELVMTGLLLLFVIIIFVWSIGDVKLSNFSSFNFSDIFLPYGVVLFAFAGSLAIPEIRSLIKLDGRKFKKAIILGSLIPIVVYLLFTVLVVGVSGQNTSEEALQGLAEYLGPGIIGLGVVFGLLALATSYLVLGLNLKHTFEYDWRMQRYLASFFVVVVPAFLLVVGLRQFITVISVSGAVSGAIIGVVILLIYQKAKRYGDREPGYSLRIPKFVIWSLISLLALGGVYEIIYLLT